jgi:3',5'-cyclic AMP phosphodiesterase CpdA
MLSFIHISDLHYHRDRSNNAGADQALTNIARDYPGVNLIVTGDITDDGHDEQYEHAFNALTPFAGRVFVCPGNHDFGAAGNFYSYERAQRFDRRLSGPLGQGGTFTGDATPVVNFVRGDTETAMLIALDSNLETEHPFDFACGEVGASQLTFLNTLLASPAPQGVVRILFLHHHPFMHNNPFMELKDAREFWRTIYGRVHVVAFGHKHVSEAWTNRNGVQHVLAADNAPGKRYARKIEIRGGDICVADAQI